MNFDFSEEQKMIQGEARRLLRDRCNSEAVRRILDSDEPYDKKLWQAAVEAGWTGIAIPEEYGGVGYGYLELCVIAEELGRAVAPLPFSSSVYLAAEAIMLAGSEEQKQKYLPKIATGEWIGTFAVAEGGNVTEASIATKLADGKLSGSKVPVADGDVAHFSIVLARTADNLSLCLVPLQGEGVERQSVKTIDNSRSFARIAFVDAPAELLGDAGAGWQLKEKIYNRAAIAFAMEQIGGADRCLEMAKEHAANRYTFGRPIGSYQAIKHKIADMFINNELARSHAYFGAWALENDAEELPEAAASARISATQAYEYAARENIQVHGGNGFTWEFDCHLFYRRAKLLSLALGNVQQWKQKLVATLEKREQPIA